MTGELAIPKLSAGESSRTAELRMDDETFAGFYHRSAPALWAYLARVSRDPTLADDLMQESYIRFLCAAPVADGEVACRRYLFTIATNLMRDHWRRPRPTSTEDLAESCLAVDGNRDVGRIEAIIHSMTLTERRDPSLINGSRRLRIATGSGTSTSEVNLLLKQFKEMQRMMKQFSGMPGVGRRLSNKKKKKRGR